MQFQFEQKIDSEITKSVKAALRFYNEMRRQAVSRGETLQPPGYETFSTMARGLMEAHKQVDLDREKNASVKDLFERTWNQRLLHYSTQRLLRDSHAALVKKY